MEVFLQLLIILFLEKKCFKSDLQMSLVLFAESESNSLQCCRNVSYNELLVGNMKMTSVYWHSQLKLGTFFKICLKYPQKRHLFVFECVFLFRKLYSFKDWG